MWRIRGVLCRAELAWQLAASGRGFGVDFQGWGTALQAECRISSTSLFGAVCHHPAEGLVVKAGATHFNYLSQDVQGGSWENSSLKWFFFFGCVYLCCGQTVSGIWKEMEGMGFPSEIKSWRWCVWGSRLIWSLSGWGTMIKKRKWGSNVSRYFSSNLLVLGLKTKQQAYLFFLNQERRVPSGPITWHRLAQHWKITIKSLIWDVTLHDCASWYVSQKDFKERQKVRM